MALSLSGPVQLRAWKQQLLSCLPPVLAERIASSAISYVLEVQADSAELVHEGRSLGKVFLDGNIVEPSVYSVLKPHEHPLALRLPVSWVLNRTIALPVAAKENLRQVISFELDRFTPFSADQVYFDYTLNTQDADSDMLSAEVALVPRKRVDAWLELLRSSGIAVDTLSASGLWENANLLPRELRPRINWKRLLQRMLPLSLVIILLAAAMALPLWQKREIAVALQTREEALRAKAGSILKLRERVDGELSALKEVRDQWKTSPPALDVLQVLTRLLPDNTSLQRMEIKGDKLTINGTSSTASSLIALLQNSAAFDAPHFRSPVTQQRGKEVFNLEARINMPFPRDMTGAGATSPAPPAVKAAKPELPKQTQATVAPKPQKPQHDDSSPLPAVGYPSSIKKIAPPAAPSNITPVRAGSPRSGNSSSPQRLSSGG